MFDTLSDKFSDAFKNFQGKGKISDSNIEETLKSVRIALLEADVNFKVVKEFIQNVKEKSLGEKVLRGVNPGEQFIKIIHDELAAVMGDGKKEISFDRSSIMPILVAGLNGQGKTTFSGKLANFLREKKKKRVLLVPADTFRPAAKDQLQTLANSIDITCFDSDLKRSPQEIALDSLEFAKKNGFDIVIIDTAGRLHVDDELMAELRGVKEALNDHNPEVLMVADAMTGQEAVNVAKSFHSEIELTGIVLSKMDFDAKGGAALSICHVTGVPIRFISTGERMKDLEIFHPDRLAGRILDMGDVLSLVEKAEDAISEKDAEDMMKRLENNKFTVDDFLKQMNMISRLGSMGSLLKMVPGMGQMTKQLGDLSAAEDDMKRIKIIISSMTKKERDDYKMMKGSHINRVARGSGTSISDVEGFLEKFKQMEKMMGGMMGMLKDGGMSAFSGLPGMPNLGGDSAMAVGGRPGFRAAPRGKKRDKGKGGAKKRGPWGKGFF